ncbi:hypothetical protein DNTS_008872 [Danionella cerebrum]|uniref:Uncharacterized protein n=1 Tax=Danionella cerebrum TaxID=2873325 RepID=A0A553Q5Y6_9TELE|nr:hypothetical protein DNTS_008872 [Danionella translucida]
MSRFRRYKYATSLPTWSPFVPRPPPPRSPSSKVNDCHESSRGHTVKAPIPRHVPTGFGGHLQPIPGILSRKAEKQHLFTENQQQLSSRQRLPPLLKPLAAKVCGSKSSKVGTSLPNTTGYGACSTTPTAKRSYYCLGCTCVDQSSKRFAAYFHLKDSLLLSFAAGVVSIIHRSGLGCAGPPSQNQTLDQALLSDQAAPYPPMLSARWHLQPIPGILSRKGEKEHLFTENQQQLSSRQRLPPLLKPLAAKEGHVRPIAAKIPAI